MEVSDLLTEWSATSVTFSEAPIVLVAISLHKEVLVVGRGRVELPSVDFQSTALTL